MRSFAYGIVDAPRKPRLRGMGLALTVLLSLAAFGAGFAGLSKSLANMQPVSQGSTSQVTFEVREGDNSKIIADRLKQAGLIKDSTTFFYYAHYAKRLDSNLHTGIYLLSPSESVDQIIQTLESTAFAPELSVTVGPGLRVLEYPPLFTKLPKFNADNFLKIVTTGNYLDGTPVSKDFWFVPPLQPGAKYALEGYLYPDTYSFSQGDDETKVIKRLLKEFGQKICPNSQNVDAYWPDAATCASHALMVGPAGAQQDLFTVAKAKYFETDNAKALYRALTMASIVIRESSPRDSHADASQIADILYRRYLVEQGKLKVFGAPSCLETDPASWYGFYNDPTNKPTTSYWQVDGAIARTAAPQSPYNTYTQCNGLPPGPISAPYDTFFDAALNPKLGTVTSDFFYLHDSCTQDQGWPHIYVAATLAQHNSNKALYLNKCKNPG